ncbi:MAG TPA: tRNA (guanosine(46)-N7)-methyltransferase TrmB [Beijerinckiaceae bacterium]|jgi:tRNA (guanine-N7-)-methyltransferase
MTEERAGAFYGRRKGKKLRAGQDNLVATLLPKLRLPEAGPVDLAALFDADLEARPTILEIGFGGGEHLSAEARAHRQARFIGCEPFLNGMAKCLATIEREDLRNIRLWDGDAAALLPRLPEAALDTVWLLYPDPWPKRRQRKRRFLSDETLAAFARILKSGGELRFATDIDDYAGWALARVLRSRDFAWTAERPDDWRRPWEGWPGTRYEAKALKEGRRPSYLTFRRA